MDIHTTQFDERPVSPRSVNKPARTVLVMGPEPTLVGGMAAVVSSMIRMDFGRRYRIALFPTTSAVAGGEAWWRRVNRHLRHVGRLRLMLRRLRPAVVHLHTCSGFSFYRSVLDMLVARHYGCRSVLHIHGAKFDSFYESESDWRRRMIRWSLTRADCVIALSKEWSNKLRRMAPRVRIAVVENAVEPATCRPSARRPGPVRFVFLARMDEWKGIDDLLAACARLHGEGIEFGLVLAGPAGSAGDQSTLPRKIHGHQLSTVVRYIGSVHGKAKEQLLADADVYVQPSHHEGLPIALLEALAYGLPVVATRVGAVPEVITNGREGLLVESHHPEHLASAMRQMILDTERRRTMSAAARRLAQQRFSLHRFRDDLLELYDRLTATPTALSSKRATTSGKPLSIAATGGSFARG